MTPEKLLEAMTDIDEQYLREAREKTAVRKPSRRFTLLIAAVIALMALAATAFAAEEIAGWFKQFFTEKSGAALSPGQIQFIEEKEQIIEETQTRSDYSLELKSVLSDQETVYMTFRITAPEQMDHSKDLLSLGMAIFDESGKHIGTYSAAPQDDETLPDNTVDFVLNVHSSIWDGTSQLTVRIQKLEILIHDQAYEQELLDTKYAGQDNILFTDEEGARIYQYKTIAEGPWEFTVSVSQVEENEVTELEMISSPVSCQTCYGYKPDGTAVLEEVLITSFILRPLGATVYGESQGALDLTYNADQKIFVVMKDDSQIPLLPAWGAMGQQHLECAAPIVLSDVDHILMPDGTQITAP